MGRFRSITHPFAARRQDCSRVTARLACVRHAASVQSEPGSNSSLEDFENQQSQSGSKMAPVTAGHFGHSVLSAKGSSTRVPTQITCQTFKDQPRGWHAGFELNGHAFGVALALEGAGSISIVSRPSTFFFHRSFGAPCCRRRMRPWLQGARSIALIEGLSTHCNIFVVRGAQRRRPGAFSAREAGREDPSKPFSINGLGPNWPVPGAPGACRPSVARLEFDARESPGSEL